MITYTFVYVKDNQTVLESVEYNTEPDFLELKTQMSSYNPDVEIDYIRLNS